MRRKIEKFFSDPIMQLVISYAIPAIGGLISYPLFGLFGLSKEIGALLGALLVALLIFVSTKVTEKIHGWITNKKQREFLSVNKIQPKRGLIFLVSNLPHALQQLEKSIEPHDKLEYIWLIPSKGIDIFGEGSKERAKNVKNEIERKCPNLTVEIINSVHPGDAQDTYDRIKRIFRDRGLNHGLKKEEIGVDFTGGTKPMSLGTIMACLDEEIQLQYTAWVKKTNQMKGPFPMCYSYSHFGLSKEE